MKTQSKKLSVPKNRPPFRMGSGPALRRLSAEAIESLTKERDRLIGIGALQESFRITVALRMDARIARA